MFIIPGTIILKIFRITPPAITSVIFHMLPVRIISEPSLTFITDVPVSKLKNSDILIISQNNPSNMRNGFFAKITILLTLSILVTGCVSIPSEVAKNETPPSLLTTGVSSVPPAPHQIYIKTGQSEQFSYWGHIISINYISANPLQTVKVTVDGSEKVLKKELTESPHGIDWNDSNLSFTLKPVVWEEREGQPVPIYESTWNTSEIYFEVRILFPQSEVTWSPPR